MTPEDYIMEISRLAVNPNANISNLYWHKFIQTRTHRHLVMAYTQNPDAIHTYHTPNEIVALVEVGGLMSLVQEMAYCAMKADYQQRVAQINKARDTVSYLKDYRK